MKKALFALILSLLVPCSVMADGFSGKIFPAKEEGACKIKKGDASFSIKGKTIAGSATYVGTCGNVKVSGKLGVEEGTRDGSMLSVTYAGNGVCAGEPCAMQLVLSGETGEDGTGFSGDAILSFNGAVYPAGTIKK